MAVRTASIDKALRHQARNTTAAVDRLAALPNGSLVAIFDSDVDAVLSAGRLLEASPDAAVWIAGGERAASEITAARSSRSLAAKLIGSLGDEDVFVDRIVAQAAAGKTVLVTRAAAARAASSPFEKAHHLIDLNTWTLRQVF